MNSRPNDRVAVALDLLSHGSSPSVVVSRLAEGWGGAACSRRTAQRAVRAAYNQLKEDFEVSECDRAAMAAQCINLLMEGAQQSLNTNNTGALVACIAQLDRLVGLSVPAAPPKRP